MPSPDNERAQILDQLEQMRRKLSPAEYARQSAKLLNRLQQMEQRRQRYALT